MLKDNIFFRFMYEADGDNPDDASQDDNPPDITNDDNPPDITDDTNGDSMAMDEPPDLGGDDYGSADEFGSDGSGDEEQEDPNENPQGLDNKVSAVLNSGLYKKTLSLLSDITLKRGTVTDNIDIIRTLNPDAININEQLQRLEDNIRDYNEHNFLNENYSKNLLFYNKCLNLYNQIVLRFNELLSKAIKDAGKEETTNT